METGLVNLPTTMQRTCLALTRVCLSASRWIGWNLELATWERPTTLGFTIVQEKVPVTTLNSTGNRYFAECLRHLAKPEIHSAKALPSAVLGKGHLAKN